MSIKLFSSIVFAVTGAVLAEETPLPSPDDVVRKVLERAEQTNALELHRSFQYTKRVLSEDLDAEGNPVRRTERVHQVDPAEGASNSNRKPRFELQPELLDRFDFEVLGRDSIEGRPVLVLSFQPRPGKLPVNRMQDRLVNRTAGNVWIDEAEFELVKADIRLIEPVTLVGGLVGAVHRFQYLLERTRLDEGVWITQRTRTYLHARQFLKGIHTRKEEVWSNFLDMARRE